MSPGQRRTPDDAKGQPSRMRLFLLLCTTAAVAQDHCADVPKQDLAPDARTDITLGKPTGFRTVHAVRWAHETARQAAARAGLRVPRPGDALGGDGKTAVLVACAPEHEHAVETAQSLRFGERCASVETRARGVERLCLYL